MNLKKELFIDHYLARPLALLLNVLVRITGKLLRIDHSLDKNFETIAIGKFKGMGSIIQSTPMIRAIRNRFPQARIVFVSTSGNRALLDKIEWIDEIITIDDRSFGKLLLSNIRALLALMKLRPGVYFDLEIYSDYSTLFTLFTLSVNRIGFYLRSSSFRMGIYTHMMFFNPKVPIHHVYLQMAKLIGCSTDNTDLCSLASPEAKDRNQLHPYFVINPNASDLRLERRWSKENYMRLIQDLISLYPDYMIYLIGSQDEQPYTEGIARQIADERVQSTAGKTTLGDLIALIDGAKAMITNDTGPMHLAFCTETPAVCLFGPCSPNQYGIGKYAHIIYKPVYCSPCVHDFIMPPCKGDNVCMKLISEQEVMTKVKAIIEKGQFSSTNSGASFIYEKDQKILGQVKR